MPFSSAKSSHVSYRVIFTHLNPSRPVPSTLMVDPSGEGFYSLFLPFEMSPRARGSLKMYHLHVYFMDRYRRESALIPSEKGVVIFLVFVLVYFDPRKH